MTVRFICSRRFCEPGRAGDGWCDLVCPPPIHRRSGKRVGQARRPIVTAGRPIAETRWHSTRRIGPATRAGGAPGGMGNHLLCFRQRRLRSQLRRKNRQIGGMLGYRSRWPGQPPAGSFVSVSAGYAHNCGVKTDSSVACWGSDQDGQASPLAGSFVSVSAGHDHSCGVKTNGSIACWGSNELPGGDVVGQSTPPDGRFTSVSAGAGFTCGVKPTARWHVGIGIKMASPAPGRFFRFRQRRLRSQLRRENRRLRGLLGIQ